MTAESKEIEIFQFEEFSHEESCQPANSDEEKEEVNNFSDSRQTRPPFIINGIAMGSTPPLSIPVDSPLRAGEGSNKKTETEVDFSLPPPRYSKD